MFTEHATDVTNTNPSIITRVTTKLFPQQYYIENSSVYVG